jgi:hypothetical protein
MLGSRKTLGARLADAVDLALDFATLGEYGLEPVEEPRGCSEQGRQRPTRGSGALDRVQRLATRP